MDGVQEESSNSNSQDNTVIIINDDDLKTEVLQEDAGEGEEGTYSGYLERHFCHGTGLWAAFKVEAATDDEGEDTACDQSVTSDVSPVSISNSHFMDVDSSTGTSTMPYEESPSVLLCDGFPDSESVTDLDVSPLRVSPSLSSSPSSVPSTSTSTPAKTASEVAAVTALSIPPTPSSLGVSQGSFVSPSPEISHRQSQTPQKESSDEIERMSSVDCIGHQNERNSVDRVRKRRLSQERSVFSPSPLRRKSSKKKRTTKAYAVTDMSTAFCSCAGCASPNCGQCTMCRKMRNFKLRTRGLRCIERTCLRTPLIRVRRSSLEEITKLTQKKVSHSDLLQCLKEDLAMSDDTDMEDDEEDRYVEILKDNSVPREPVSRKKNDESTEAVLLRAPAKPSQDDASPAKRICSAPASKVEPTKRRSLPDSSSVRSQLSKPKLSSIKYNKIPTSKKIKEEEKSPLGGYKIPKHVGLSDREKRLQREMPRVVRETDQRKRVTELKKKFKAVYNSTPAVQSTRPEEGKLKRSQISGEELAETEDKAWQEKNTRLSTDEERKQFASDKFGNSVTSDPTRCLDFHGSTELLASSREEIKEKTKTHFITKGKFVPVTKESELEAKTKKVKISKLEPTVRRTMKSIFIQGHSNSDKQEQLRLYVGHVKKGLEEQTNFLRFYAPNQKIDEEFVKTAGRLEKDLNQYKKYGEDSELGCRAHGHPHKLAM